MDSIKSFIYLDEYKMYSISSQIFEGLTEYILQSRSETEDRSEAQKGPLGSGRVLGNIINRSSEKHEKTFLHDYSYTLFEKRLFEDKKAAILDATISEAPLDLLKKCSFVKIRGRTIFNDMEIISSTVKGFNEFGKALAYVTTYSERQAIEKQVQAQTSSVKDRNKRAQMQQLAKASLNVSQIAKQSGLNMDQEYLNNLSFLLKYGYNDQLELQIPVDFKDGTKMLFSCPLKRELVREKEHLLIKKHSRNSEREFCVFGVPTQWMKKEKMAEEKPKDSQTEDGIKKSLQGLVSTFSNVENTFIGRLPEEIIVDPIAVYLEL